MISACDRVKKKHGGKRKKCWLPAFSSFPPMFSIAFAFSEKTRHIAIALASSFIEEGGILFSSVHPSVCNSYFPSHFSQQPMLHSHAKLGMVLQLGVLHVANGIQVRLLCVTQLSLFWG